MHELFMLTVDRFPSTEIPATDLPGSKRTNVCCGEKKLNQQERGEAIEMSCHSIGRLLPRGVDWSADDVLCRVHKSRIMCSPFRDQGKRPVAGLVGIEDLRMEGTIVDSSIYGALFRFHFLHSLG